MRFLGKEHYGEGITVAIVDSGINASDPRLRGVHVEGWSIQLGATGHALLASDHSDQNGHGTEIAAAVVRMAPKVKLLAIKIMGPRLRTSAELMAAGIETGAKHGARVINLSLGTPNMGKALLLRDCCANAVDNGSIVLAAAHPKGERAYPADLPETVGVAAHPDCPLDKHYYFNPKRFGRKEWGSLSDKFLTHGHAVTAEMQSGRYRGSGLATAYLSGAAACIAEAMPGRAATDLIKTLKRMALVPVPEIGYS
jgi:subtilisin family serine protease